MHSKTGPYHNPRFVSLVEVQGKNYVAPDVFKSAKEAQNQAARMAINALTTPDHPFHTITSHDPTTDAGVAADDESHLKKNQLFIYAQQQKLGVPTYKVENFGPQHDQRFIAVVSINGKCFYDERSFTTKKRAEHAAAKVALMSLSPQQREIDRKVSVRRQPTCISRVALMSLSPQQREIDSKVSVRRQSTCISRVDGEAKVDAEDQGHFSARAKRAASREQKRNKELSPPGLGNTMARPYAGCSNQK